jgi:hypothetical protein
MDFGEMAAHGPHKPAGSATDFERFPAKRFLGGDAAELGFQPADDFQRGREKPCVVLPAPPEGDVISRVIPRARIPILAHLRGDVELGHGLLAARVFVEQIDPLLRCGRRRRVSGDDLAVLESLAVELAIPILVFAQCRAR